jgi:hypothetical protein
LNLAGFCFFVEFDFDQKRGSEARSKVDSSPETGTETDEDEQFILIEMN